MGNRARKGRGSIIAMDRMGLVRSCATLKGRREGVRRGGGVA